MDRMTTPPRSGCQIGGFLSDRGIPGVICCKRVGRVKRQGAWLDDPIDLQILDDARPCLDLGADFQVSDCGAQIESKGDVPIENTTMCSCLSTQFPPFNSKFFDIDSMIRIGICRCINKNHCIIFEVLGCRAGRLNSKPDSTQVLSWTQRDIGSPCITKCVTTNIQRFVRIADTCTVMRQVASARVVNLDLRISLRSLARLQSQGFEVDALERILDGR